MRNIVILGRFEQTNELGGGSDFAVIEQTLKYDDHHGVDDPDPVGLSIRAEVLCPAVS